MFKILSKLFKSDADLRRMVEEINALEPEIQQFTDSNLQEESGKLKGKAQEILRSAQDDRIREQDDKAREQAVLNENLPRAFALVREAAKRTLHQRHFDVQLMGGIVLHQGKIAEMRTGEGKTLAATAPAYLNALAGKGVHVVTVNEYLAKRDTVWMGQIYHLLGLKVACLIHDGALIYDPQYFGEPPSGAKVPDEPLREGQMIDKERDTTGSFMVQDEYLRPISRREAYEADITYGTNHEFGFDYLRDNLVHSLDQKVQRAWHYAIIDEVDSILIDEARTPLIISAPDTESSQLYKTFARLVSGLKKEEDPVRSKPLQAAAAVPSAERTSNGGDYTVDEKQRSVYITEAGIEKVERTLNVKNLYAPENLRLSHYLEESLKAKELFLRDKEYVVKDGEIIIVDQFTGRLMIGRRYSGGLHQAIEAKEGVQVQQESRTYATISIQNYFRMYKKLAGMTGTAQTSAEEFDKVYKLEVATIPTHRQMIRADEPDSVYKTRDAKYDAIIKDIKERHAKGQPILIGTVSIEKNEELSRRLAGAGLKYEMLNAKNNEREGAIIAQAGHAGAITVATNMAGRGVDIILGGNPPKPEEAEKVKAAGGLHVIGTERHEARRVDNQLRGRAGRQGDPGSSQFFLSLEDDLMRIFGGDRIKGLMERLNVPDDMPIQAGMINKAIGQAQAKVEGMNFDSRKHLLEYDDVLNKQRLAIYKKRDQLLETGRLEIRNLKLEIAESNGDKEESEGKREIGFSPNSLSIVLSALDMFWMNHLENMEALREAVYLRAYGQHDPLVEYRREGHLVYQQMLQEFETWITENKERLEASRTNADFTRTNADNYVSGQRESAHKKVGRNDPCPCGAKDAGGHPIKYKKCHGK